MPSIMKTFQALDNKDVKHPVNLTPDAITRRFSRICKKLRFKLRFHDLRHYHASLMHAEGIPDKYAMKRMGHATVNMLHKVYQHIRQDAEQEFTKKLNESLRRALNGEEE